MEVEDDLAGLSENADELGGETRPIFIHYDYAYLDITLEGTEGTVEVWEVVSNWLTQDYTCYQSETLPLASGSVSAPLHMLAWAGTAKLSLVAKESTAISIKQRPIPGCGDDPGTVEPTEADLQACQDVQAMIQGANDRINAYSCG